MRKYILIILAVLLLLVIFLRLQSKRKVAVLRNELIKQEEIISKYQDKTGIIPSSAAITKMKDANATNERELKKILGIFDTGEANLPEDVSDKGIYFYQLLHNSMKQLEREATSKKMVLPPVDFSIDVPRDEDIPYLLKQIEMIDDIMGIVIRAGKCEIATIRPLVFDRTKKSFDFEKLSLQIVMTIDTDALVNVLSQINSHAPVYFIEDFSAVAVVAPQVKVSIVLSRILTGVSLDSVAEFKNKEIFDLNSIYPLDIDLKSFAKRNPFFRTKDLKKEEAGSSADSTAAAKQTAQTAAEGAKPTPQFTYKGNINTGDNFVAIIEDNWQSKVCFSKEGDLCSGYKVTKIEDKKAVLSKDKQEIILLKGADNEQNDKGKK